MGGMTEDKQFDKLFADDVASDKEIAVDAATIDGGIILPGGEITITASASALFKRIAPMLTLFVRGGAVQRVVRRDDMLVLKILAPVDARSEFERHTQIWAWRAGRGGEPVLKRTIIPLDMAAAILACDSACDLLPKITGLLNCPMLVATHEGGINMIGPGYDPTTGIYITGGSMPPIVELPDAVASLKELVEEYDFQTSGDRSRALASLITPALKLCGHIRGNIAIDIGEADKSQSGKTYRQQVVAAVYNEKPSMVTDKRGGVGSLDESLNAKLAAGRPFIQFDNFRGKLDSPHVEAFATAEGRFPVRLPHAREFDVDPSRFILMLTSNGVETTRDFANRGSIIRNRKRVGHKFKKFAEGDLLEHVRAQQPYYLGCVFTVVCRWLSEGRQRTDERRHDFREWAQTLDWIVQNILREAPLMDGHGDAQERVSNPDLTFLRNIALAVADRNQLNESLSASALYDIATTSEPVIAIPGLREPNEDKGKLVIGSIMARLFKGTDTVPVDMFRVRRDELEIDRDEGRGKVKLKTYTFERFGETFP